MIHLRTYLLPTLLLLSAPPHAETAQLPKTNGWVEVQSENFTVFGNAGAKQVRRTATDLERFREVLGLITKGFDFSADVPTSVYMFKTDGDLEPYKLNASGKPRSVAGYFLERPLRKYIAIDASAGSTPKYLIFHEYVHSLMQQTFSSLPLWLNEGLAEYYSTFRFRENSNTAEIGHPIDRHLYYLGQHSMIGLDELFSTTHRSSTYNEGTRQGVFYAQSWALVHYLVATDERRKQFGTFLRELRDGAGTEDALRAGFGVDLPTLEKQLEKYMQKGSRNYWFALAKEVERAIPSAARPMQPGDVLYRLGDLLAQRGRSHAEAAVLHLEAALERGGPENQIYSSLGVAAEMSGRDEHAAHWYRKAIETDADDSVSLSRLASLLLDRYVGTRPRIVEGGELPELIAEARQLFRRSLQINASNVEAMAGMGKTFLFGGDDAELGLRLLAGAATVRPFRTDILHDLAALLARSGRREGAWAIIENDLRPKARNPGIVTSAEHWVVEAELKAARELADAGDSDGAVGILARAAERTGNAMQRERLERARVSIETEAAYASGEISTPEELARQVQADAEAFQRLIGLNSEAALLAEAGKLEEAAKILDQILEDCKGRTMCDRIREDRDRLRTAIAHNRLLDRYSEAVELIKKGERTKGVEILREIERQTTDADFKAQVQSVIRDFGDR